MRLRVLSLAGLLLASTAAAQPPPFQGSRLQPVPPVRKVAQLGACTSLRMVGVTDGINSTDCSVGGGTTDVVCYCMDGTWAAGGAGSSGTVSSVGLALPSWLAVSGSPVTTTGTLTGAPATGQTSHLVIGTCNTSTTFGPCALVAGDLPALPYLGGTVGTVDNAIPRADGTGGSTLQGLSLVTISDAGAIATTPGVNLSLAATAPTATTGASQAGKPATITASNAVASTDTAGAAAGGDVTVTGGNAARNTSGNANGGNIILVPGSGIGTGTAGQVVIPFGTVGAPGIAFNTAATRGIYGAAGATQFAVGGVSVFGVTSTDIRVATGHVIGWSAGAPDTNGADAGIDRVVAKVLRIDSGAAGATGWLQWAGECFVAADQTNATATLATSTCSITVTTGRKYRFSCWFDVADSVAGEGIKIDFGGGTATSTNFRAFARGNDAALVISTALTSLTGTASAATFTGDGQIEVHGSFEPSGNGTFLPRFAQNSHSTGTATLYRGSGCLMWDFP